MASGAYIFVWIIQLNNRMLGIPRECWDIASCNIVLTTGKTSSFPVC